MGKRAIDKAACVAFTGIQNKYKSPRKKRFRNNDSRNVSEKGVAKIAEESGV